MVPEEAVNSTVNYLIFIRNIFAILLCTNKNTNIFKKDINAQNYLCVAPQELFAFGSKVNNEHEFGSSSTFARSWLLFISTIALKGKAWMGLKSVRRAMLLAAVSVGFCVAAARADDCSDAVSNYNSATSELSDALHRYVNCISASRGTDDCSSEFRRVRSAQDDFESAVGQYQSNCNQ